MKLPELCIYCQKRLTGDSIEGTCYSCIDCKGVDKDTLHEWHSSPMVYVLHDNYNDGTLSDMTVYLKALAIHIDLIEKTCSIRKLPNPYHNIILTLNYIPELDLLDREKLIKWADGLHKIAAFS